MGIIKQWPVLFLLLAFAIAPLFQGSETDILATIHILVLVVFVKALLDSHQKLIIPVNSLALSICLFYIWMALSISWSPAPSISLYMFVWLCIFPLCFFTYSLTKHFEWSFLAGGILCITLIFAVVGIIQHYTGIYTSPGPSSLFAERNTYAGMLNIICLPTTGYLLISLYHSKTRLSVLLVLVLFILFFAIVQTGSRGATIALVIGLVFIVLINLKQIKKFSLLIVIVTSTIAFYSAYEQTVGLEYNIVDRLSKVQDWDHLVGSRGVMWGTAWKIIKNNPFIGTGIGTYFIVSPALRHVRDPSSGNFVHNNFLQIWLETGAVGLCLMIFIMATVYRMFIVIKTHTSLKQQDRFELTGLMAGLVATTAHSFVDFHFYILSILMVMGFIFARIQEISMNYYPCLISSFIPSNQLSRKLFIALSVIIPAIILHYSLSLAIADYFWSKSNEQFRSGQIEQSLSTLDKAVEWNPKSIGIRFQQVAIYRNLLIRSKDVALQNERKNILSKALFVLNKIEGINSIEGYIAENRGYLLLENKDIVVEDWQIKAINEFRKALKLRPKLYRSRVALAKLLDDQGNLSEAVELINEGLHYYYSKNLSGVDEFQKYAVRLNIQYGDTTKAREIEQKTITY